MLIDAVHQRAVEIKQEGRLNTHRINQAWVISVAKPLSMWSFGSKLSRRKFVSHRQRAPLVRFQGDFLGQHDVARDERIFEHKAPAQSPQTGII